MNKFSEAYAAGKKALEGGKLAGDFEALQPGLKSLLAPASGPDAAEAAQLAKLRKAVADGAKPLLAKGGTEARANAKTLIAGAGDGLGLTERAATLKMLRHLYHVKSAGGQVIWVYAPPEAYAKWLFDEVAGADATALENALAKAEKEVYSETQRGIMASAVQTARSVAMDVCTKLGGASDATKTVVRRYFGNKSTTDKQLVEIMLTLAGGYKKIANACNGGNIVISDEPGDRTGGGWKDWAFIYTAETMSVIYLQGAWLKKADEIKPSNQSPLYRCVRTIIHELSHKEVGTEDVVYGPKGLMPEGSSALTPEYALHNADSWAYFAVDVLGHLTGPDKTNGETACSAILKAPVRTLTAA
jgi:hypothetical protein